LFEYVQACSALIALHSLLTGLSLITFEAIKTWAAWHALDTSRAFFAVWSGWTLFADFSLKNILISNSCV